MVMEYAATYALPAIGPDVTIHQLIAEQSARTPARTAILDSGVATTYAEIDTRSAELAAALTAAGVRPGTLVGVCMSRTASMVIGLVAVLRAGAAYVPLDPVYPPGRLSFIARDAQLPLILTDRRHAARVAGYGAIVVSVDDLPAGPASAAGGSTVPGDAVSPDDLAYILYTSGSTGRPNGVEITHRGVTSLLRWAQQTYEPDEVAGTLFSSSINFDMSVFEVFFPLAVGGSIIVAENVLALPELPDRDRVTMVDTVPSAMTMLLRSTGLPAGVRTVNLAGEAVSRRLADLVYRQPQVRRLLNLYGATEDSVYSTWSVVDRQQRGEPPIGIPMPGRSAYVVGEDGQPAPDGQLGELWLAGEGLARQYHRRPKLTAQRFVTGPDGRRAYRTGDIARKLPTGEFEYHGRLDHQVKIRGVRVEPDEVARVLERRNDVLDAAVVARDSRSKGRYLVAYVVPGPAIPAADWSRRLRAYLARHLPVQMVPDQFVILAKLPLTPNGKLDRAALPEPSAPRPGAVPRSEVMGSPVPAGTQTEDRVADAWRALLRLDDVGRQDNFLDLGGSSIVLIELCAVLTKRFGVEVTATSFLRDPTVAAVAAHIDGLVQEAATVSGDM